MRMRVLLLLLAIALVGFGLWLTSHRRTPHRVPEHKPKPEVAIQDGKTIDFSNGQPLYRDNAADHAAMTKGVAAMDAAAANVTFAPTTTPPPAPAGAKQK